MSGSSDNFVKVNSMSLATGSVKTTDKSLPIQGQFFSWHGMEMLFHGARKRALGGLGVEKWLARYFFGLDLSLKYVQPQGDNKKN